MTENEIRIERIKTCDLIDFASREIARANEGKFIPITMQRAISHTNNPYAEDDDVSLLVAYQADSCVGFFGIMPVILRHNNEFHRVFWFTTWRVSPEFKGRSLGSLLMEEALSLKQDYIIVGSGPARHVCQKFGFFEREPLTYYQVDLTGMDRLNPLRWLMRLTRRFLRLFNIKINIENSVTRSFQRVLTPATKNVITPILWRNLRSAIDGIVIKEVERIQHDPDNKNQPRYELYRNKEVINWMVEYPWILEPGNSLTQKMDYYFSDTRSCFRNIAVELCDLNSDRYRGFLVMSVSIKDEKLILKTLDFSVNFSSDYKILLATVMRYAREHNADFVELPQMFGGDLEKLPFSHLIIHEKKRIYQFHPENETSPLGIHWKEITLNYCDGDMAFS